MWVVSEINCELRNVIRAVLFAVSGDRRKPVLYHEERREPRNREEKQLRRNLNEELKRRKSDLKVLERTGDGPRGAEREDRTDEPKCVATEELNNVVFHNL